MTPLRVLLASWRSHPQVGGEGVYVRELSRALGDLGHQVTVVSGPPYPELASGIRLEQLPALDQPANALSAFRPDLFGSWTLAELLRAGVSREMHAFGQKLKAWLAPRRAEFDVIHDNQGLFDALPKLDLPTMATLHHPITVDLGFALAAEPDAAARARLRRQHSFLATQARVSRALPAILTVSEASKAKIVSDFGVDPARIRVSHCGVDHDVFRERPEIRRDPNLIVSTVSADVPHKGLVVLIEAMADVAVRFPAARLAVVGPEREGPALAAIQRLGLSERVFHLGRKAPPEIADLFADAAVVATPSLFEGFGLPPAEAMACSAAVVVTDGGALPEVVGDAGLVVRAGDPRPLAEAIVRLLGDEALRRDLGARGVARAQGFSWRSHALAATECYRDAGVSQV